MDHSNAQVNWQSQMLSQSIFCLNFIIRHQHHAKNIHVQNYIMNYNAIDQKTKSNEVPTIHEGSIKL